jgi:ribosome-binding ATPase
MKDVALVGLAACGKSTVFTAVSRQTAQYGTAAQAVVEVPDDRLQKIAEIYASKKITHGQVRIVDIAGIDARAIGEARAADALAIVLRAFGPDADPKRDLASFRAELAVTDLATVEKVHERVSKEAKKGTKDALLEQDICVRAETILSDGHWLSEENWAPEERRVLSLWTPLTLKPSLHVINAEDPDVSTDGIPGPKVVICGALEAEATELSEADAAELLHGFGIEESGRGRFIRAAYDAIDLLTFFTAGPTEARAWEVRKGAKAPQAAGAIHSDFERAFIRAERVAYDDIVACGSEDAARKKGLLRAEGKEYVVQEGDVLLILHSA